MSRTSRTLLVLGVMAVAAVGALAWMAERYGKVLEGRRQLARGRAEPGELPEADAERLVQSYLAVLDAVRRVGKTDRGAGEAASVPDAAALRRTFELALVERGLDRVTYQELDGVARAWSRGSDEVPAAYREAFDGHAAMARGLLEDPYDPLGP